jgi:hypothetical protein
MPHLGFTGFTNTTFGDLFSPTLTVIRHQLSKLAKLQQIAVSLIEAKRPVQDFTNKVFRY